MKELVKQYLDRSLSRRELVSGLSAIGMSTVAAKAVAQSLETFGQGGAAAPPSAMREVHGTGGALFVAQLKAAGVKYVFFNPSTGDYPIFDALVDEPSIQVIKGYSGRRGRRHGGRLCQGDGQAGRGDRGECRPDQRHDPDAQQLEGSDPTAGGGRLGRPGATRPRPASGGPVSR